MKRYLYALFFLTILSSEASADHYYRDRAITGMGIYYVGNESILLINIDGDRSGAPACANSGRLAINSSAPHYKEIVSIAMAAYVSAQKKVDVYANENCTFYSNAENIQGLKIGDMTF